MDVLHASVRPVHLSLSYFIAACLNLPSPSDFKVPRVLEVSSLVHLHGLVFSASQAWALPLSDDISILSPGTAVPESVHIPVHRHLIDRQQSHRIYCFTPTSHRHIRESKDGAQRTLQEALFALSRQTKFSCTLSRGTSHLPRLTHGHFP